MIELTEKTVDNFVARQTRLKVDVRWDGWTLVFFNRDERARQQINGRFRNGAWGYETRIPVNTSGIWRVKPTLTRGMRNARR